MSPAASPPAVAADAFGPALACDPTRHHVLLSWVAGDSAGYRVWFARSTDRGATWSAPVPASPAGESVRPDPEASPRMVCDEQGRIGLLWSTLVHGREQGAVSYDVRFARSLDGGATWSAPLTLNDDTTRAPGSQSFHDLTLRANGGLFAAWLDSRPGSDTAAAGAAGGEHASIWFARSEDFGLHWGPNAAHWSGASHNSRVSLAVDPGGNLFAAFRLDFPDQVRDIVLARPGGPPVRMHDVDWKVAVCPPSGPAMALSRDGTLRLAWYTGAPGSQGVWFREDVPEMMDASTPPLRVLEVATSRPVHAGVGEAGMSGTLIACDADSTGADLLTLARVEPSGRRVVERFVMPGSAGASYPCIATERAGRTAYVAWTHARGNHSELRVARWALGR